jgi:hypothetical protein
MTAPGPSRAAAADATVYKASRPGFTILFQIKGHQVLDLRTRYALHCPDAQRHRVRHPSLDLDRPFNLSPNSSFVYGMASLGDGIRVEREVGGTFNGNVIRGYVSDQRWFARHQQNSYRCWSGRSKDDPRVAFVARRR